MALGLEKGKLLWTVPNSFVASANCGLYCGAQVDFVDIDPLTYNISILELEKKLRIAKKNNNLPDILIPVHFSGQSCDMETIHQLSKQYGFKVIEDAAHSIGASYKAKKTGSCTFSDIAVFSTHPVKIITSGEGGLLTTNDEELYRKLLMLRSHGITKEPKQMIDHAKHGSWYFEQQLLGYNYRMTDIQAALGISQLDRLDCYVNRRLAIATRYKELLDKLPLQLPLLDANSSWHLYVVRLKLNQIKASQQEVFNMMRAEGIAVNLHYIPIHIHPLYKQLGFKEDMFPRAENYYKEALTLPLYPGLDDEKLHYVCETLAKILNQ
jgi:UDP-4-amino-4,6-dideoxy-N-acetyl-beta-L-altrosamine transaminase